MRYFYLDGQLVWDSEDITESFQKGQGIIWSDGERYRVVDTWFSIDHHGHFNDGLHVFMELVDPKDDLPRMLAPAYFRD